MHLVIIMCILIVLLPIEATGSFFGGLIIGIAMLIGLFKLIGWGIASDEKKKAEEAKKRKAEEAEKGISDEVSEDEIKEDAVAEPVKPYGGVRYGIGTVSRVGTGSASSLASSSAGSRGAGSAGSYGSGYSIGRPGYNYDVYVDSDDPDFDDEDFDDEDIDDDDDLDDDDISERRSYERYRDNVILPAGGLPRDVSPYWEISDPYERAALEDFDFYDDYANSGLFGDDD